MSDPTAPSPEYELGQTLRHLATSDVGKLMHRYRHENGDWIYVVDIPRGDHYLRRTGAANAFERIDPR